MEELENLKNPHSRMLYLIGKMYREGEITQDVKINLKYLVFLNDANLLNILQKRYTNIEDMKEEIKYLGKNLTQEDLEEELKNSDLFKVNTEEDINETTRENQEQEINEQLAAQSSPISSFLRDAKKRKQKMDKSVSNFHIEQVNQHKDDGGNPVIKECDFGASPKFQPVSRRNR